MAGGEELASGASAAAQLPPARCRVSALATACVARKTEIANSGPSSASAILIFLKSHLRGARCRTYAPASSITATICMVKKKKRKKRRDAYSLGWRTTSSFNPLLLPCRSLRRGVACWR
jgi:hypothetical protein